MWGSVTQDLHDVYAIIDEVADFELPADSCLLLTLETESNVIALQARTREEVH